MEKTAVIQTNIGPILIAEENEALVRLSIASEGTKELAPTTDLLKKAAGQLREYLDGNRREFDLPLAPKGTAFQQAVWKALLQIPYGKCISYKQLALEIGNEKAVRAVGAANGKNPIAILIPCHRVIGSDKSLTGYAYGLAVKEKLLTLEGVLP